MRRLILLAAAGTLAALALTTAAAAKGPTAASLTGPGLGHPLPIKGLGEVGNATPLGSLVQLGGFFPEAFAMSPDLTIRARPAGDLGPRYRVIYRMRLPGGNRGSTLVQEVYPYAKPRPVTYMRPGQTFWNGARTHGGWFVSHARLKASLVAAGLPRFPPAPSGSFPWGWTVGAAAALVVLLALIRQRLNLGRLRSLRTPA